MQRRQSTFFCILLVWLLVAAIVGGYSHLFIDFMSLIRGPLPTLSNLQGGSASLVGLFALAGLQLSAGAVSRLISRQREVGSAEQAKISKIGLELGRHSQSIVFLNVCLTILTYAIAAALRGRHPLEDSIHNWIWLAIILGMGVAIPWALAAMIFSMAADKVRRETRAKRAASPVLRAPFGPIVPLRFGVSAVFRSYITFRYGFILSCVEEILLAVISIWNPTLRIPRIDETPETGECLRPRF